MKQPNIYFIGEMNDNFASNYGILYIPEKSLYYGTFVNGEICG
jgi:hypothetical protein